MILLTMRDTFSNCIDKRTLTSDKLELANRCKDTKKVIREFDNRTQIAYNWIIEKVEIVD